MDFDALWRRFADHLARLYAGVVAPTVERGPGWLAVLSNEQHTDVNICVLLSGATPRSGEDLIRILDRAAVRAARARNYSLGRLWRKGSD